MAIVLWIGIVIAAQAFQATPREHAPAVVIGLLPGLAAWIAILVAGTLRAAAELAGQSFDDFAALHKAMLSKGDLDLTGLFALDQGFIATAMILSAATVSLIERR